MAEYRQAPVKHADETGWRTNGQNSYTWLFATSRLSLFLFRQTRAASTPQQVFGKVWLPGCLVVDRYGGYKRSPAPSSTATVICCVRSKTSRRSSPT
jgi:transposase